MYSACRILEDFGNRLNRMFVGEATERAAVVLVREKPRIAKFPKSGPNCALYVWRQHAGVSICSNSIGVTLDVILGAVSKSAHQPGEKTSERRNGSPVNSA